MKNIFKLSALLIGLIVIGYGCKKDKSKSSSTQQTQTGQTGTTVAEWKSAISPSTDVSVLISELEKPLNTKTVMAAATGILHLDFPDKLSVDIYLPLRKSDGTAVTGNVEFKEILLRKKGDFIRQNRPTQTIDKMLVTGGSYFLKATQGGEELTANYSFILPQSSENFDLFEGRDAGNNQNVWDQLQDSGRWQRNLDSTNGQDSFYRYCCTDKFKWINCDYFYNCNCPLTAIKVKLPEEFGNLNTQVMCLFNDINSVTSLRGNKTSKLFETGGSYKAPIGKEVTIVVMCRKDGKYYFKTKDVTLTLDGVYELTPAEVSLGAMKTLIDNL